MFAYNLSLQITSYSSLFLGFFVLFQNRKCRLNQIFFIFSLLVAIYSYFMMRASFATSPEQATLFSRFMYIGVILIPIVFYHLTLLVTNLKSKWLPFFYLLTLAFLLILPTNIFISGTRFFKEFKIYSQRPGQIYNFFLLCFFSLVLYSLFIGFKKLRTSTGNKKIQLSYFVYGSSIGFIGGMLDFLPKYGIFIPLIHIYCNYLIAIYIASFAYAIIKHRLMDITVIIRKGLIYSTIIGLFTGGYLVGILLLGQLFQEITGQSYIFLTALTIILTALCFQPLKIKIQDQVDRVFFKDKYDYQKTLKELSQAAAETVDINKLLSLIAQTVVKRVKINSAAILIVDKSGTNYVARALNQQE